MVDMHAFLPAPPPTSQSYLSIVVQVLWKALMANQEQALSSLKSLITFF